MRILVTGGAGYIGSVLVPMLLQAGHQVRVLDKLLYGGNGILPNFLNNDFEFIKGDILDEAVMSRCLDGVDCIIHLAAIVGYPACKQNPRLAQEVNVSGAEMLENLRKKDQLILYASTGSNYGKVAGKICDESTPLAPLTIYGRSKTAAETHFMNAGNSISYRFATAFGVSNRLRLDLLINDFVYQAVKVRNLIIYEKTFKRSFIHVKDLAASFLFALDNIEKMRDQVYNVGSETMNYSKADIGYKIREKVDFYLHFADVGTDEDQRNYECSYEKIRNVGFETTIDIDHGINELIRAFEAISVKNSYSNV